MDEDLRKCLLVEIAKYTRRFKERLHDTEESVDKIVGYKKLIYREYVPKIIFRGENADKKNTYPAILVDKVSENVYPIGTELGSDFKFNESIFSINDDKTVQVHKFQKGDRLYIYTTVDKQGKGTHLVAVIYSNENIIVLVLFLVN